MLERFGCVEPFPGPVCGVGVSAALGEWIPGTFYELRRENLASIRAGADRLPD